MNKDVVDTVYNIEDIGKQPYSRYVADQLMMNQTNDPHTL